MYSIITPILEMQICSNQYMTRFTVGHNVANIWEDIGDYYVFGGMLSGVIIEDGDSPIKLLSPRQLGSGSGSSASGLRRQRPGPPPWPLE